MCEARPSGNQPVISTFHSFFPGLVERGTCRDGGDGIAILTVYYCQKYNLRLKYRLSDSVSVPLCCSGIIPFRMGFRKPRLIAHSVVFVSNGEVGRSRGGGSLLHRTPLTMP